MPCAFKPSGEAGLLIIYGEAIDEDLNPKAVAASEFIRGHGPEGIVDVVPAYSTVLVLYQPWRLSWDDLLGFLQGTREVVEPDARGRVEPRVKVVPAVYGGEYGPDMEDVCAFGGLTEEEVITVHSGRQYRVYFLGFTPGFAYLGQVDNRIAVPRVKTPRQRIPTGSVALAGRQTGVYPYVAPGGWRLIGRTPLTLFRPQSDDPVFFAPGDMVRFERITEDEYHQMVPGETPEADEGMPDRPLARMLSPGLLTTVQDAGRMGSMHLGASRTGAADLTSFYWANILVGNERAEAGLEITALGPSLTFLGDAVIAITGADMEPTLDGEPVPAWQSVSVVKGSTLRFGAAKVGLRGYLAVAGGVDVPLQMGSRSTDTVAWFGGYRDRALKAGDVLGLRDAGAPGRARAQIGVAMRPALGPVATVRAVSGPQDDHFTDESRRMLESQEFAVRTDSDRMGLRLKGQRPIPHSGRGPDIVSEGICPGAVQVPGSGQPIVMLVNAQTTGGYAKIATVITPDLSVLAQARPGDRVKFRLVSVDEAQQATRDWWQSFEMPLDTGTARYLVEADGRRMVVEIRAGDQ